jgi:hypothetical protein
MEEFRNNLNHLDSSLIHSEEDTNNFCPNGALVNESMQVLGSMIYLEKASHTLGEEGGASSYDQENRFVCPSEEPQKYAEYGKFLEINFAGANSKNLCVQCWCLCNRYQMSKHKELNHRLLTPKYFKDLEAFKNLANQCGRFKDI